MARFVPTLIILRSPIQSFAGGAFSYWSGPGYDQCYKLINEQFVNVSPLVTFDSAYSEPALAARYSIRFGVSFEFRLVGIHVAQNNYAAGTAIQNLYMTYGGTNWGNMHTHTIYSSYE